MTLNASGPISLGGATTGQSINLELGNAATALASINSTPFRTLAGVPSGQISLSSFYGKSSGQGWFTLQVLATGSTANDRVNGAAVTSTGAFVYASGGGVANCATYYNTLTGYNSSGTQLYSKGSYTCTNTAFLNYSGTYQTTSDALVTTRVEPAGDTYCLRQTYLVKYTSISTTPAVSWHNRYTLSVPSGYSYQGIGFGLASDSSGNIYQPVIVTFITYCCCTPIPNRGYGIFKVNSSGTVQYFKYPQQYYYDGIAKDIKVTSSGTHLYINGASPGNQASFTLGKYATSDGTLQWLKRYTSNSFSPLNQYVLGGICVDASDNVYSIMSSITQGITVSKVNSSGTWQLSSYTDVSTYLAGQVANCNILYGSDGFIYVAGSAYASSSGSYYIVFFKFNTSLVLQYARAIKGVPFNSGRRLIMYNNIYQGNTSMSQDSSAVYILISGTPDSANRAVYTAKLLKDGSGTATGITFSGAGTTYNVDYEAISVSSTNTRILTTETATGASATMLTGTTPSTLAISGTALINMGYSTIKTNI